MDARYVHHRPAKMRGRDEYDRQRLPKSERGPGYEGLPGHGKLTHSTDVIVAPSSANPNHGDTMRRYNKMFNTMQAVENLPTKGRSGEDITASEDYRHLSAMPVFAHDSEQEKRTGWFAIDAGSEDKAKKLQARVNVCAKAGAGTFKTKHSKGATVVYVKRISETYSQQRNAA